MNPLSDSDVKILESVVKKPKLYLGIWDDRNAYFPHLDGASVMTFEAQDLADGIAFAATAENALAWTLFLSRHTELRSVIEPARN